MTVRTLCPHTSSCVHHVRDVGLLVPLVLRNVQDVNGLFQLTFNLRLAPQVRKGNRKDSPYKLA